jgi:hypothetical protein
MRLSTYPLAATCVIMFALGGTLLAGGTVTSGPQVGQKIPGPFKPLNINGPDAGKNSCLYCRFGARPVVMVFAREVTPALRTLVQQLEKATAAHADCELSACVIVCNETPGIADVLGEMVRQDQLKNVILAVTKTAGPESYKLAADADVTVLLYSHTTVAANHSYRKGELNAEQINAVVADVAKIVSNP